MAIKDLYRACTHIAPDDIFVIVNNDKEIIYKGCYVLMP